LLKSYKNYTKILAYPGLAQSGYGQPGPDPDRDHPNGNATDDTRLGGNYGSCIHQEKYAVQSQQGDKHEG